MWNGGCAGPDTGVATLYMVAYHKCARLHCFTASPLRGVRPATRSHAGTGAQAKQITRGVRRPVLVVSSHLECGSGVSEQRWWEGTLTSCTGLGKLPRRKSRA
jgi:hypothetical protein